MISSLSICVRSIAPLALLTRSSFFICLIWTASLVSVGDEPEQPALEFFESKIRPVLVQECFSCHSQEAEKKANCEAHYL